MPKSDNLRPAYWIGVDDGKKDIIMCVRGTASISDCLTDLSQSTHTIMGGEAPLGMYMAAKWCAASPQGRMLQPNPEFDTWPGS